MSEARTKEEKKTRNKKKQKEEDITARHYCSGQRQAKKTRKEPREGRQEIGPNGSSLSSVPLILDWLYTACMHHRSSSGLATRLNKYKE